MADEGAGNLDIQKSINDAIAARSSLISKQTEMMKGQVLIAMELCKALRCEDLEGMSNRIQDISTALASAQQEAERAGSSILGAAGASKTLSQNADKAAKSTSKQGISLAKVGDVISSAFMGAAGQLDAMISVMSTVASGIFGIGQALISIPLTIFSVIMESASELANSTSALAQAMEKVRATFGDLSKAEGAQVIGTFDQLDAQSSNLAGTGLSLSKVFGSGPEGLAAAMEAVAATAEAMGPVFGVLSDEFATAGAEIMMLQKGLGLTGEAMKGIGSYALSMGESMEDTLMQNANLALQLGEKFGVSSKLIAQDLGYMQSNMGKFGSVTKTQMTAAATYVRKLGMEIKDIEGLLGAFDDFETAATSASKLAQAFGMNVDAMQMMQEQDPAKRLDMLRQSFAATGKSIENMSRQEKALLAQSAGLDENTVSLALSTENMGLSYEEVMAGAEEAADSQKSEAEIMLDVAENIERVIENLNETTSSFFETFLNGFMKGISRTEEYRAMQRALANALQVTFQVGVKVGEMFVKLFPGVKEMMLGITDIFNPERVEKMGDEFVKTIGQFFEDLGKDPVKAVKDALGKIQSLFLGFFSPKSSGASMLSDGVSTFVKTIVGAIAGLGGYLMEALGGAMSDLAGFIRGDGMSEAGEAVAGGLGSLMEPFKQVLIDSGPILLDGFLELFKVLAEKLGPKLLGVFAGLFANQLVPGLGPAITLAIGASNIEEKIGGAMQEKLESGDIENKGSAAGAMLITGFIDSITFGMLSPETLTSIATAIAGFYDKMLEKIKGFSPLLASAVDENLQGIFKIFSGFGDIIKGLLSGDTKKIEEGAWKLLDGLKLSFIAGIKSAIAYAGIFLQKVVPTLIEYIGIGLKLLANLAGTAVRESLKFMWKFLSDGEFRGYVIDQVFSALDSVRVWLLETIGSMFSSVGGLLIDVFVGLFDGLFGTDLTGGRSGSDILGGFVDPMIEWLTSAPTQVMTMALEVGKAIIDGILGGIGDIASTFAGVASSAWDGLTGALGINSPSKLASEAGENITAGLSEGMGDMSSALSTATEGLADAFTFDTPLQDEILSAIPDPMAILPPLHFLTNELAKWQATMLEPVMGGIIEDFRHFNDEISNVGAVELSATIGKLGDMLGLKDEVLKVENKPIEMHVTLNLTMRAEDIAKEIFDVTAKMVKDPNKASDGQKEIAGVK